MEPRTVCEKRRITGGRSKAVWGIRSAGSVLRTTIAFALLALMAAPIQAATGTAKPGTPDKLDRILAKRAATGVGRSRVIVVFKAGADGSDDVRKAGGSIWRRFSSINGQAVEIANGQLRRLAESAAVESLHVDRPLNAHLNRAAVTIGARAVQEQMGYDGAGVGVAVIDSGVTSWHDDLTYNGVNTSVRVVGGQRVARFVDFVNGRTAPYDDNGHGTHVSGIIAGNGYDTRGARAGIAPAAHIVSLKVLDSRGAGFISNVIAALDWSITNKSEFNIRVVNLSVGAPITESYTTDPLTQAAKRAVDAGLVVVAAAGNLGRNAMGESQYGGITSPGNAPWVLTVGASNTKGTITRTDDEVAPYSSRGPSAIDFSAKPDVIAPGTGIVSLSDATSSLYVTKAANLLSGTLKTAYKPYLALSGTSMAAPMVSGTAALMIQANPKLTPNLVKAILEYTAQKYAYDSLTQGAGFLNARGAVDLARFFVTAKAGQKYPSAKPWGRTIIWGNQRLTGGVIKPAGTAWATGVTWGSGLTVTGSVIVWGTLAGDFDNIVWGTSMFDAENIVWGTMTIDFDNIVWGTALDGENIVWGTTAPDTNVVWGAQCAGANCENIVWGSSLPELDSVVSGTAILDADNIVWGTCGDFDNIVWGTADDSEAAAPLYDDPDTSPPAFDVLTFDSLFTTDPVMVQSTTSGDPMQLVVEPVVEPVVQPVVETTSILGGGF